MISALEAKKKTDEVKTIMGTEECKKQLEDIEELINMAICTGKEYCFYKDEIHIAVKNKLHGLGYEVNEIVGIGAEEKYRISWE